MNVQRQLTAEQRRQAEESVERINRLGQQYGIERGQPQGQRTPHGLISNQNTSMPVLSQQVQGSRYSRPFAQPLLHKKSRVADIFNHDDYFRWDCKDLGAENFSVQKVFKYYLAQVSGEVRRSPGCSSVGETISDAGLLGLVRA